MQSRWDWTRSYILQPELALGMQTGFLAGFPVRAAHSGAMRKWLFLAALIIALFGVGLALWRFGPKEPPGLRRLLAQSSFSEIDKGLARFGPERFHG